MLEIDGVKVTQTAPILLQLADQYGRFGGETPEEKFALLRWLFWDNHKLTGYMATYRFMRTFVDERRSAGAETFPPPARRLPRHPRAARHRQRFCDRREAERRRHFSMMAYLHYPSDEHGYDFAASHPGIQRLARPHGRAARLETGLRPAARPAHDALREID